ncbi:diaminopimelate decarboxylase family protein [Haliangium ochraceum]|uniref:diaminopimelate decarboxylase family protein n=1 Tax=Haliangium ochraceum TaxID=80816 RepID=UPI00019B9D0C|nr:alanine racemase [Haliangium ochraceum]
MKEIDGLATDEQGAVFPGSPAGTPLLVRDNVLRVEGGGHRISVPELWNELSPERGVHVVHADTLRSNLTRFSRLLSDTFARDTLVAWALKSFPVQAVVNELAKEQCGADVGSLQELRMALAAGIPGRDIICTGVAKSAQELRAIVDCGATCVLDNADEAAALESIAASAGRVVAIGVRVNPEVATPTHAMIATGAIGSKFGVPIGAAEDFVAAVAAHAHLRVELVHMHIGAHFYHIDPESFARAINREAELVSALHRRYPIRRVDIGGGFRFPFLAPRQARQMGMDDERFHLVTQPDVLERTMAILSQRVIDMPSDIQVVAEPGTAIVCGASFSLGQVLAVRELARLDSPLDGRKIGVGWVLGTASTAEFILRAGVPNLLNQTCIADKAEERDFAAGVGGPLCFAGDVLSPPGFYLRMARPRPGDVLCLANTGAYIGCGFNFHNLPRFAVALMERDGNLRTVRRAEPENPMAHVEAA